MRIEGLDGKGFISEYGGMVTLPMDHMVVHQGKLYLVEYSASVNNAASMNILIKTPAGQELHSAFSVAVGGACTVYLFEGTTVSNDGTPITPVCQNRVYADGISTTFFHTPTITGDGTALINGRLIPGGNSPTTRIGAQARDGAEWLLKPSTNYCLRITNTSGSAAVVNPSMQVYERPVEA